METRTKPLQTNKSVEEDFLQIEGIDWQDGLSCFAYDEDVYLSIIRSYVDNIGQLIEQIRDVTEETLSDYAISIHGIKGSSYSIRANDIGRQAEELEHAAKAGNFQLVSQKTPSFVENTQELLDALSGLFKADTAETDKKPSRYAPDETLLDQMVEATENFDINTMEEIIESLSYFKYETQAELVTWLQKMVSQMDFLAIAEGLMQRKQGVSGD